MAYSHSQLQLFNKCALRYRFKYVDKLDADREREESLPLTLWSATHNALEFLYKQRRNYITLHLEDIVDFYDWFRSEELKKMGEKYGKSIFDDTDIDNFQSRGREYIKRYYQTYFPFDQAITDSVEKRMIAEILPWVKFQWIIDRIDIKNNEIQIIDYKTNRSIPTDHEDTIRDQLNIYGLAIQQDYGDKFTTIIGKVIYLHLQKEYTREITQELIDSIKNSYSLTIWEIEKMRFAYHMWDQEAFKPSTGRHCDDCAFHRLCPIYKHMYDQDDVLQLWDFEPKTVRELIDEVYDLWQQSKELDNKKAVYLELLKEYAISHGYTSKLRWTRASLKIDKKKTFSITADIKEDLYNKISELWLIEELTSLELDKKKIEQYLESWSQSNLLKTIINPQDKVTIWRPKKIGEKDNLEWDWVGI